MMGECIGELIEKKEELEDKEVHWKIPDFLSLPGLSCFGSSTFDFLNARWYLQVRPSCTDRSIALELWTDGKEPSCNVLCTFGFENVDGSLFGTKTFYNTFCDGKFKLIALRFTRRELSQRHSELMPSSVLTIVCKLKLLDPPMQLIELDTLSENMKNLLTNKELCDTTLLVKDREFKAHKIILAVRSPIFAAMFKHEMSEKLTGVINIPDFDPDIFEEFLKYLYCGKLENISFDKAFYIYGIADKYDVQGLKMFCVDYMQRNLKIENVDDVIALAEEHRESDLLAAAKHFFDKNKDGIKDVTEKFSDCKINF